VLLVGDSLALGGTEGQFVEIACGLKKAKWDVHVRCLRAAGPLRRVLDAAGLHVESCGPGSFRSPRVVPAILALARYLRRHRIELVHSFDFYSNLLSVPAARIARVPLTIASQRDLGDLRPRLQQRLHRAVLRLADLVVVNSPVVAERLRRRKTVAAERLVLIPNGVDVARFAPAAPVRSGGPWTTSGTLANLRPEKGLTDLVRAAALVRDRHPHHRVAIWGEGPMRGQLQAMIRESGLANTVHLRGTTMAPAAALRELDVFVLPSLSEACSNALLQAMATGRPVVATAVGGNTALITANVTGLLVPPGDARALAAAITRLIDDPSFAAALGARACRRVQRDFGVDRMLANLQSLYERGLAEAAA
jgi:glycosyltransferase involved in cell wall biosynthesis